ncbi:hypothetical protein [Rhodopseudomonas telluris]|uniref:Uncharacterized protein n=1 Tax=Rhodopseudomonas telluris TaxID=644215 RepID=A0ABV6ESQ0_9BRAD
MVMPTPAWGAYVSASNSCLILGCMPDIDGPTQIVLGDSAEVDPGRPADFVSLLRVPDGEVRVTTVGGEVLLRMPAPPLSLVEIWRSHPKWPETVIIGINPPASRSVLPAMLPTEQATRAVLDLPEGTDRLFLYNVVMADRPGVFNPWLSDRTLASGLVVPIAPASKLEVTDAEPAMSNDPVFHAVLPTPNRRVGIFPTDRCVMLRADTAAELTRVRAWVELRPEGAIAILALTPAEKP